MAIETILVAASVLLLVVFSPARFPPGWASGPAAVLIVGMPAGRKVRRDQFDDRTRFLGIVALAYILFSGGLGTDFQDIRQYWAGLILATVGVLTAGLVAVVAIGSCFRSKRACCLPRSCLRPMPRRFCCAARKNIRLKSNLKPLLGRSGSNDRGHLPHDRDDHAAPGTR